MNENVLKIFEFALNQEQTGLNFFESSLERLGIGAAVSAFKQLIEEERKHVVFISGIIEDLKTKGDIEAQTLRVTIEPVNYFDERARSEFLDECISGSMIPDVTVFNTAWLIEKDLSEFYAKMAEQTEGKAREALLTLSAWEKLHEVFFKEFRDKLSDAYSKMPWGG
jgi:rubrerythrin